MGAPEVTIDVEPATGIWRTDGVPMIYLPRHFLVNNHKATEEALGRDAYATILRTATDKSAFDWCTIQSQRSSAAPEEVFRLYFERLSQRGWGRFSIEFIDVDAGRVSLRLDQSVFVLEEKRASAQTLCYMFEGFLTGALRFLSGGRGQSSAFSCHEAQCAGHLHAGHPHGEFCRFEARCDLLREGPFGAGKA